MAASKGKLTVSRGKLTRLTCVDNRDLLIPLIKEFGTLKEFSCLFSKMKSKWYLITVFLCMGSLRLPRYEAQHSHGRGRCLQISSLCSAQGVSIAFRHLNNITLIGRSEQFNCFVCVDVQPVICGFLHLRWYCEDGSLDSQTTCLYPQQDRKESPRTA